MRSNCMLVVALSLSFTARAQDDAPKLKVSGESLTREQAAVYRAVLQDVLSNSKDMLNLANTPEPIIDRQPGALVLEQGQAIAPGGHLGESVPRRRSRESDPRKIPNAPGISKLPIDRGLRKDAL